MSHEVERIAYVGARPWHGLGTHIYEYMSWSEAIEAGGLDWNVHLRDVLCQNTIHGGLAKVPGHKAVVRGTDGAVLGMVTSRYRPIQNTEAFAVFERLFGSEGRLETVGSLRGGQTVFGLAQLKPSEYLGEIHRRYLLCQTRHDGSGACLWFPTDVRVVCMNTNNLALSNKEDRKDGVWVSHTGNVKAKIEAASEELARAFARFTKFEEQCVALADTKVDSGTAEAAVAALFPGDDTKALDRRARILHLARWGQGNEQFAGTAYGLYNGITEYVDHRTRGGRASNISKRFDYSTMGSGAQVKAKALNSLLQLAA